MTSCEESGNIVADHFPGAWKMVQLGSGSERKIKDYNLSRLACYLIVMNGDPRKPGIAAAQQYFAVFTRAHEIHLLRTEQEKRLEMHLQVANESGQEKLF